MCSFEQAGRRVLVVGSLHTLIPISICVHNMSTAEEGDGIRLQ